MAGPSIGDLIEIPTRQGLAYAQYTHQKAQWGALIRVLPGLHGSRPPDLEAVAKQKETFSTFFPLKAAIAKRIFKIVGKASVPPEAQKFPLFRAAGGIDRDGRVLNWFLWDGEREWKVDGLTDEQRHLPIRGVWNDTLLVQRIEEGWTPETDRRSRD
jgi:hypothetical protein